MRRLLVLASGLLLSGLIWATPTTPLDPAHVAYQKGDYAEARRRYEAWLRDHGPTTGLLYDLGNTCYQQGDLGWALAYYQRALLAAPRDADLRANYAMALNARRTPGSSAVPGWLQVVLRSLMEHFTLNELTLTATAFYLLAAWLAYLWLHHGELRRRHRWVLVACLALAVAWGGLAVGKAKLYHDPARVVVVSDGELLTGPADSFPVVRRVYEGETGRVTQRQGVWCEVRLDTGVTGWLGQAAVVVPTTLGG